MALSNIFHEPRREITETAVGFALPAVYIAGLNYWAAAAFASGDRFGHSDSALLYHVIFTLSVGVVGLIAFSVLILALVAIHALGEKICDALDALGVRLRPR